MKAKFRLKQSTQGAFGKIQLRTERHLPLRDAHRHRSRRGGSAAGYAGECADLLRDHGVTKVLSSLMFHQVPLAEKRAGLAAIHRALAAKGTLHIADYGLQRTPKMRNRFRLVQKGDGFDNTEPNARGVLPELMSDVGFWNVEETHVFETLCGSISMYRAVRAS